MFVDAFLYPLLSAQHAYCLCKIETLNFLIIEFGAEAANYMFQGGGGEEDNWNIMRTVD